MKKIFFAVVSLLVLVVCFIAYLFKTGKSGGLVD